MLTIIKDYIKKTYNKQGNVYLGLVHRLDRPVGGVMVFAKTSKAASRLSDQVRTHALKKNYMAIVYDNGTLKDKDTFVDYLYKDRQFFKAVYFKNNNGEKFIEVNLLYNDIAYLDKKCYNVGLHGCCIFFSEKYISEYDGLCDKTYMGGEEMILFVQMLCDNKKTVYLPEIEVLHLEGAASKADRKKVEKKRTPRVFKASRYSYILARNP